MSQEILAEKTHDSFIKRYFTARYKIDVKEKQNDHCILTHSNKISIITLAPSHPIISQKKSVQKISFQIDKRTNRLQNKVSGKSKRGAQQLSKTSVLCHVTCGDGSKFELCSCLRGYLVEVNEQLFDKPELLTEKPFTEGYIGIVMTKLQDHISEIGSLLSEESYKTSLEQRLTDSKDENR